MFEQISIFDLPSTAPKTALSAVSLLDSKRHELNLPEPWMKKILPSGEYCFTEDNHPYVLTRMKGSKVPAGHLFRHFDVNGTIFSATAVG